MTGEIKPEPGRRGRGRPPKPAVPSKSALSRLGRALREVRDAEDLSLTAFAAWSTYSKGHLSRVEHGEATPSRELVEKYEARFGTDGLLESLYEALLAEQKANRSRLRRASGAWAPGSQRLPARTRDGDRSEFVADLTIRDGERVRPAERLVKRWRIRNGGTVPWIDRSLERDGASAGPALIASPRRVQIADTQPGETVDIEVGIKAPTLPGSTIAYWKMVDSDGEPCFPDRYADGVYVELVVRP